MCIGTDINNWRFWGVHLMFVPFISKRSPSRRLFKRKGGGGKGSSGKGATGSPSTAKSPKTGSITSSSKTRKTSTYENPIVPPRVIPAGQPYAGRIEGGAGRAQIFGTRFVVRHPFSL